MNIEQLRILVFVLPGLLIDLVDPVGIVLGVDVVEAVVLEAQAERVELTHTLRRCANSNPRVLIPAHPWELLR